jgi:predicted phage baseplate assembly protein
VTLEFLPNLPKANLDDRTYDSLMQECLMRVARYCPEWTNHNPSDPGVTLIELFAWLTDQMLMRFNQVPRRNYITFLELLGIRLQPPVPSHTELTFYLVSDLPESYTIPAGIEVATERTADQPAIIFSTDDPCTINRPKIRHFLSADTAETTPSVLRDRLTHLWNLRSGEWSGQELALFQEQPAVENCFYLVLDADRPVEGNVIALTLKGQEATPTGINPNCPPRRWEAWNGTRWQPVLLQESDDQTQGFSFSQMAQAGGNPLQGADVLLHLPLVFPVTQFTAYRGYWLRCVHIAPPDGQPGYTQSPRLVGMAVRSVGGTVRASQCEVVQNERLGVSNGNPGQVFQLQRLPVLERQADEYLMVTPPGELAQRWQEVADFAGSTPQDRHYLIDSNTGTIQFGPRVHEPSQRRQQTELQSRFLTLAEHTVASPESSRTHLTTLQQELRDLNQQERQYGAVPVKGATLQMVRYRTGGGQQGNVQRGLVNTLKVAVPYINYVINHKTAVNGSDAESIEQAAIRVPQLLRSRDRAVTPEDFEALTQIGGKGSVARVRCLPTQRDTAGTVNLLVVPRVGLEGIEKGVGLSPDELSLTPALRTQLLDYLDERRLLGIEVRCLDPEYVGVTVQTEVALEPRFNHPDAQEALLFQLRVALYRFLNPICGGREGQGWGFGQPVYPSDIIALFQQVPGIRHIGAVQLFEVRRQPEGWVRLPPGAAVYPGEFGLVCSWADGDLRSAHRVNLLE